MLHPVLLKRPGPPPRAVILGACHGLNASPGHRKAYHIIYSPVSFQQTPL